LAFGSEKGDSLVIAHISAALSIVSSRNPAEVPGQEGDCRIQKFFGHQAGMDGGETTRFKEASF